MSASSPDPVPAELPVSITINGRLVRRHVRPRTHLADFLRHELGLTGTHVGCEQGACGACTIFVDGLAVRSCLMQAVQADGCAVTTIEGMAGNKVTAALQEAFVERNAAQCGYCSPGMIATATELLTQSPSPSRDAIRHAISGNFCRCTGYQAIVDAIELAASRLGSNGSQG